MFWFRFLVSVVEIENEANVLSFQKSSYRLNHTWRLWGKYAGMNIIILNIKFKTLKFGTSISLGYYLITMTVVRSFRMIRVISEPSLTFLKWPQYIHDIIIYF